MKILLVNNYHYLRGGSERAYFDLSRLLEDEGHEVFYFSTINPQNKESKCEEYFVQDYDLAREYSFLTKIKIFFRMIYNREAKRKVEKIIKDKRPDIVHIHNIYHHLSPSILKIFRKYKIPVIQSLHDYKMICPNYRMFRQGKICDKCIYGNYFNCFKNKCINESYLKSFVLSLEAFLNKKKYKNIDLFICPSRRQKEIFIKAGVDRDKLLVFPHFFETNNFDSQDDYKEKDYLLYYGRLSKEKGVEVLIKALVNLPSEKLVILGEGEEKENLKSLVSLKGLEERVEFRSWARGRVLTKTIKEAKAVIFPFLWEEVFGYTLLESLYLGKFIIASNTGAVSEIIEDGHNGILFNIGDIKDLKYKILEIDKCKDLILPNTKKSLQKYDKDIYYKSLINIYEKLMKNAKKA